KIEQERNGVANKIEQNSVKIKSFLEEKEKLLNLEQKLKIIRAGHEATIKELKSRLTNMYEKKTKIKKDIEDTTLIIEKERKANKLPKIRIIPLDAIPNSKISLPQEQGIMGVLSDFIKCEEKLVVLKNFIFGNIILVDSKESAYILSKKGFKTVTIDGQFFEADANAIVIDINSKISNLTK